LDIRVIGALKRWVRIGGEKEGGATTCSEVLLEKIHQHKNIFESHKVIIRPEKSGLKLSLKV